MFGTFLVHFCVFYVLSLYFLGQGGGGPGRAGPGRAGSQMFADVTIEPLRGNKEKSFI